MRKIVEYMRHSTECREMARTAASPGHREQLIKMAETWEQLAEARKRKIASSGKSEDELLAEGE